MNKDVLIGFMFDQLENEGAFRVNSSKEYVKCSKYQQKMGEIFYDFIRAKIQPKELSDEVKHLAEEFIDACHSTYYSEFKIYYHRGFLDGIKFASK